MSHHLPQSVYMKPFNHIPSILFFRLASIVAFTFEQVPVSKHKMLSSICTAIFNKREELKNYRKSITSKNKTNAYSSLIREKNLGDFNKTPFTNPYSTVLFNIACEVDKALEEFRIKKLTEQYIYYLKACNSFYNKAEEFIEKVFGVELDVFNAGTFLQQSSFEIKTAAKQSNKAIKHV
ncbi:MAG: hypothetical protein PHE67_00735 [Campylobacterales bacterium]|nr:hypothetical protein [Campylobacterales bacterium]